MTRRNRKRKQPTISAEEQARISARSQAKKVEKKRIYKARCARELAEREAEQAAQQAARVADPLFPLVTFCESMGEMPWSHADNNWGFEEEKLSIPVPPPNDTLESVNGVPLKRGFTYRDLATAVYEASTTGENCGGICQVESVKLSENSATKLIVEFNAYAFREDGFQEGGED
jgi:hypothetical protein